MTLLRIPTRVSAAADRPASYGNRTISSTRPIAAKYRSRRWMWSTLPRPSDVYDTQQLSWQRLKRYFTQKRKKSLFEPPFRGLRGNVCTLSIARLKAHCRLYIRHNWTFFAICLRLRRCKRKSVEVGVFWREWVTLSADFGGRGRRPPTTVGVRVAEWLPYRVVSKYLQCTI